MAPGVCYGQLDVAADAAHTAQCVQQLFDAAQHEGLRFASLKTSQLQRCTALAGALGERLGLPPHQDARLAEMDFGTWEGLAWDQIPKAAVDAWTDDFANHAFGGHESTQQVLERVWSALQEARQQANAQLWVTHAGVLRAVRHLLAQGQPRIASAHEWPQEALAFGRWVVIDLKTPTPLAAAS